MLIETSKVLLVDDSKSIIRLLKERIDKTISVETVVAHTCADAKALIERDAKTFFVAVLDLHLPDAPNGEIVDFVREKGIPVIVLTGSLSDDLRDRMLEKNVFDYVVKQHSTELNYVAQAVKRVYNNQFAKILIVDDSITQRQYLHRLLDIHKFQIFEAKNGVDALEVLDQNPDITLVLTDYNMPKMDGLELISRIRRQYSRSEMCIIGFSQQGSGALSAKLLKTGANDFITRPFLLEEFYVRLSQNIDLIEQIRTIRDSANRDYLTGVFNRKYLFEAGDNLYENAKRGNIPLATAMVDIDFFKKINDTYGHFMGDLAIKKVCQTLKDSFRKTDIVARYGGEEFCVLANVDAKLAKSLFERVRRRIEALTISHGEVSIKLTVSIGVTLKLGKDLEQMLSHADARLYHAKESGRNNVVID